MKIYKVLLFILGLAGTATIFAVNTNPEGNSTSPKASDRLHAQYIKQYRQETNGIDYSPEASAKRYKESSENWQKLHAGCQKGKSGIYRCVINPGKECHGYSLGDPLASPGLPSKEGLVMVLSLVGVPAFLITTLVGGIGWLRHFKGRKYYHKLDKDGNPDQAGEKCLIVDPQELAKRKKRGLKKMAIVFGIGVAGLGVSALLFGITAKIVFSTRRSHAPRQNR